MSSFGSALATPAPETTDPTPARTPPAAPAAPTAAREDDAAADDDEPDDDADAMAALRKEGELRAEKLPAADEADADAEAEPETGTEPNDAP